MIRSYDPFLVTLSVLVAIFASYTALDLAYGVSVARGRARLAWLAAGAVAMGVGIWSMHFVGMLAFRISGMPVFYDVPRMMLSTGVAIVASALALFVVSRRTVSLRALVVAAIAMGAAIAGMHYIGIWSMQMPATIDWNVTLVATSVAIAIGASFMALWLAFRYRFDRSRNATWVRAGGGVVMGLAVSGMHYVGMAAARFVPTAGQSHLSEQNVVATAGLGIAVTGTTLIILAVAIAGSAINRELARRTTLAAQAETARRDAEALTDDMQRQTGHLQQQTAELELLNAQLSTAEERLRGIIDSALDAVVSTDAASVILDWSRHAEAIFGWTAAEVVGRKLTETIIPAEYRQRHLDGMRRFLATGERRILGRRTEMSALRKDGREFPVELTVSAIRSGPEVMFTSFIRDITDQKRATEERREREAREQLLQAVERERSTLSALFEQAPAFIAITEGPEHVYVLANARYHQLVGHRDIIGKPIRQAVPELEGQGYFELHDQVYATGEPYVGTGARVVLHSTPGADAEERYVNFVYQPITDAGGAVSGLFVHAVDVTEIVRARKEAEAASRAKNDFLGRMSHELRTPLNAILGFGQLLAMDAVTESNKESVDHIVRAGKHLLALIDEVLEISRIEAGQLSLSVEPVRVEGVVDESMELVRHMATTHGIALSADVASAHDRFVVADQQRLKQVLLNLLSNAIKYNRTAGSVVLTAEETADNRLRLIVRDTGYGMTAAQVERLFTPFERLGADQTSIEGSGLGLALSRGLMEAMGGILDVESTEGKGTRFWVELPIADVAPAAADTGSTDARAADPIARNGREMTHTVLVIEDNLANVRLMERIFQRRPHVKLLTAMQGSLGIELAREHRPDLVMLDLNLPDVSGDKVLLTIRQDPALRDIPVVMISGDAIPAQVQRLLDLGAHAYLTKPFNLQELFSLVDECLGEDAN